MKALAPNPCQCCGGPIMAVIRKDGLPRKRRFCDNSQCYNKRMKPASKMVKVRRQKITAKERRWRHRLEAIAKMGGKCELCGMDESRVLQFDHRIPVGSKKRQARDSGSDTTYRWILNSSAPQRKYALLCANCHVLKTFRNGDHLASSIARIDHDDKRQSTFVFS